MEMRLEGAGAGVKTFGRRPNTPLYTPGPDPRAEALVASISRQPSAAPGLDPDRVAAWRTFAARLAWGAGAAGLLAWKVHLLVPASLMPIFLSGGGLKTIGLLFAGYVVSVTEYATRPLRKLKRRLRDDLIQDVLADRQVRYQPYGFDPPAFDRFRRLELLPAFEQRSCRDLIEGERTGAQFSLYQARLTVEARCRGQEDRLVFAGQLMQVTGAISTSGVTVVRHRRGLMADLRSPAGLQPVSLGVSAFDRAFQAFGTDQVEARTVLHPGLIEKLIELDAIYVSLNLGCAFMGSDLLVVLEGAKLFNAGDLSLSAVSTKDAEADFGQDLDYVYGLIDRLLARPKLAYA